jgi:RNA recognition motif-containing protein
MGSKVFVGNLDFNTSRDEVQSLFSQIGSIRDVFLPTDRESGRPRGFAFVEYENEEDAAKAIEKFNGYELSGRALRVNAAEDRPRGGSGGGPPRRRQLAAGGGTRAAATAGTGRRGQVPPGGKSKGSRRDIRAAKRSL